MNFIKFIIIDVLSTGRSLAHISFTTLHPQPSSPSPYAPIPPSRSPSLSFLTSGVVSLDYSSFLSVVCLSVSFPSLCLHHILNNIFHLNKSSIQFFFVLLLF